MGGGHNQNMDYNHNSNNFLLHKVYRPNRTMERMVISTLLPISAAAATANSTPPNPRIGHTQGGDVKYIPILCLLLGWYITFATLVLLQ
jgi:hypothetical protein